MVLWKRKNKKEFLDLSERMRKQQNRINSLKSDLQNNSLVQESSNQETSSNGVGSFFSAMGSIPRSNSGNSVSPQSSEGSDLDERRKRLGKRLLDMTNKIEDLNNQVYQLQQRIEVLERKNNRGY